MIGVDEAGRGPLAGPVVAAAVMLNPNKPIEGLRDSKQLTAGARERLAEQIKMSALAWHIASATVEEIDQLNILQATLLAMSRAILGISRVTEKVLIDGLHLPPVEMLPLNCAQLIPVVRGDQLHPEISAASILAKVARDAIMQEVDRAFPDYQFAVHKGYPTKLHLERLQRLGPTPWHRKSFGPVKRWCC